MRHYERFQPFPAACASIQDIVSSNALSPRYLFISNYLFHLTLLSSRCCCHLAVVVLHNLVPWYLFISNISFISPCCHLTVVVLLHNLVSMVSIHQQLSLSSHPAVVLLLLSCITS